MSDTDLAVRPSATPKVVETSATALDTSSIIGWGVDANPQNDPTYPYRDRSGDDHSGQWTRPTQQQPGVEILQSVEHKQLPAVFGTASPPSGISGMIRRLAFRWTESNLMHWMLLMGADRVNMVEGLVEDLAKGKIPNIPKEMGVPAEWKHNRTGFAKKIAIAGAVTGGLLWLVKDRKDRNRSRDDSDAASRSSADAQRG